MARSSPAHDTWDETTCQVMCEHRIICRRVVTPNAYESPWHRHVGIGVVYCQQGRGVFAVGDRFIPYVPGTLIYFNSLAAHQVRMRGTYERWDLCFWPEDLNVLGQHRAIQALLKTFHLETSEVRFFEVPGDQGARLHGLFEDLSREITTRDAGFQLILELRLVELHLLLKRFKHKTFAPAQHGDRSAGPARAAGILAFIEERLPTSLTVEAIAAHFHYCPSYIHRLIRQATGQAPTLYIKSRRLTRARALLLESDLTITAIAAAVGICHAAHFCRLFRAAAGCTPSEYRRLYKR